MTGMLRSIRAGAALTAVVLLALVLAACGGSAGKTTASTGSNASATTGTTETTTTPSTTTPAATAPEPSALKSAPADVVALVGKTPITRAALSHWIEATAGGDFYEIAQVTIPRGMFSDPPRLATCQADMASIESNRKAGKVPTRTPIETCRGLEESIKEQALEYLIGLQRAIDEDAEVGVKVTDAEVAREFKKLQAELYPKEGDFQRYLAQRDWTTADNLVLVKHDLLNDKLVEHLERQGGEKAFEAFVMAAMKRWTARTACRSAYMVKGCAGFSQSREGSTASPAILIEDATGAGS